MFSEAEKREYRSIRPPEELRQRVLELAPTEARQPRRRSALRRWQTMTAAACLALALLAAALLPRADLRLAAEEPLTGSGGEDGIAVLARAAGTLTVPVTVSAHGETALSVSHGQLRSSETGEAVTHVTGSAELLWELDAPDETQQYHLHAVCGDTEATLTLAFDPAQCRWTAQAAQ